MSDEEGIRHVESRGVFPLILKDLSPEECVLVGVGVVRQFLLSIVEQLYAEGVEVITPDTLQQIAMSLDGEFVQRKKPEPSERDNQ